MTLKVITHQIKRQITSWFIITRWLSSFNELKYTKKPQSLKYFSTILLMFSFLLFLMGTFLSTWYSQSINHWMSFCFSSTNPQNQAQSLIYIRIFSCSNMPYNLWLVWFPLYAWFRLIFMPKVFQLYKSVFLPKNVKKSLLIILEHLIFTQYIGFDDGCSINFFRKKTPQIPELTLLQELLKVTSL